MGFAKLAALVLALFSLPAVAQSVDNGELESEVMVSCTCVFVDSFPDRSIQMQLIGRDRDTGRVVWAQGLYNFTCGGVFGDQCGPATNSCRNAIRRERQCRG